MKGKFLTQFFTDTPLTVVGLVLFFLAFVAVVYRVYFLRGSRKHYDKMAALPFSDGEIYE